jgi:BON domain-containing protein
MAFFNRSYTKCYPSHNAGVVAMNEDRQIRTRILNAFGLDSRLNTPRIRVAVENGGVRLSGDVGTPEAKAAAELAVRTVPGVRHIINNLSVQKSWVEMLAGSAGTDGHERANAEIRQVHASGLRTHHDGKPSVRPKRNEI